MSVNTPYSRLAGTWTVYVADAIEAIDPLSAAPTGNWVALGPTVNPQELRHDAPLVKLYDNDSQGPVKAVRPQEDLVIVMEIAGLTQENYATLLHNDSNVAADAGPPATKTIPAQQGYDPSEYSLALYGASESPYGDFPGQWYFPRVVFGGSPTNVRAKDGSPALRVEAHVLHDSTAAAGFGLGQWVVQTA